GSWRPCGVRARALRPALADRGKPTDPYRVNPAVRGFLAATGAGVRNQDVVAGGGGAPPPPRPPFGVRARAAAARTRGTRVGTAVSSERPWPITTTPFTPRSSAPP